MLQWTIRKLLPGFSVELKELIRKAHHLIEAKETKRITQDDMAHRIGVGHRTYLEYQRGTNAPLAMKALLNLLNLLDDDEIVKVVREWKKTKEASNDDNQQN